MQVLPVALKLESNGYDPGITFIFYHESIPINPSVFNFASTVSTNLSNDLSFLILKRDNVYNYNQKSSNNKCFFLQLL